MREELIRFTKFKGILLFIVALVAGIFDSSIFWGIVLFIFVWMGATDYYKEQAVTHARQHLKRYDVSQSYRAEYTSVTEKEPKIPGQGDYYLRTQDIMDEDGCFRDELIAQAIIKEDKRELQERERWKNKHIKAQRFNGFVARCDVCDYTWTIRKKHGLPARCIKCHSTQVEIDWKLTYQEEGMVLTKESGEEE